MLFKPKCFHFTSGALEHYKPPQAHGITTWNAHPKHTHTSEIYESNCGIERISVFHLLFRIKAHLKKQMKLKFVFSLNIYIFLFSVFFLLFPQMLVYDHI